MILIIFILLFPAICDARLGLMGGSGAADNPCPTGTYMWAWNGDYTSDTDKSCEADRSTTIDGTVTNASLSATYGEVGVGLGLTTDDQDVTWAVTDSEVLYTSGTVWMSVKSNTAQTNTVLEIYGGTRYVDLFVVSNGTIQVDYYNVQLTSTETITDNAWERVAVSWDLSTTPDSLSVSVNGVWKDKTDTNVDTPAAFTTLALGCNSLCARAGAYTTSVDNVYVVSGYKTADPYSP